MPRTYLPARGDLVWLDFSPQAGHEQAGHRPALVVSPRAYNERAGLALCCPITRRIKGYSFEVVLPEGGEVTGAILADQVRSLDFKARAAKRITKAPRPIVQEVLARIAPLVS